MQVKQIHKSLKVEGRNFFDWSISRNNKIDIWKFSVNVHWQKLNFFVVRNQNDSDIGIFHASNCDVACTNHCLFLKKTTLSIKADRFNFFTTDRCSSSLMAAAAKNTNTIACVISFSISIRYADTLKSIERMPVQKIIIFSQVQALKTHRVDSLPKKLITNFVHTYTISQVIYLNIVVFVELKPSTHVSHKGVTVN